MGDALALSTGKLWRGLIGERLCSEQVKHFINPHRAALPAEVPDAKRQTFSRTLRCGNKAGCCVTNPIASAVSRRNRDAAGCVEHGSGV